MPILDEVVGDVLDGSVRFVAHGCNAQGVMASGIAKDIRARWPRVFNDYQFLLRVKGPDDAMGHVAITRSPDMTIFSAITQKNYGYDGRRYVDYHAIETAFRYIELIQMAGGEEKEVVGIPMIGAGLGGGDWNVIRERINNATRIIPIVVYRLPSAP